MGKIQFTGSLGHTLDARLEKTPETPKAYTLFAHCFTCSKDVLAASTIAKSLAQENIAMLRFDFTGLGASEGDFSDTNFTGNIDDLIKAADYMRENLQAPKIIIGHSLGGAAVLKAAHSIPEVTAVVTIAAPCHASHVTQNFIGDLDEIIQNGQAALMLSGRPFTIKKQFIDDLHIHDMDEHITNLKRALLVMHAPLDQTVGIENAEHIFKLAKHPKSFVSLGSADHLLRSKEHAAYAGQVIAAWAARYI
jgi:putative redox protein